MAKATEEQVAAKQQFLEALAVSPETREVEGATVRALTAETYQAVKTIAGRATFETKGDFDARRAAAELAEQAAILAYGVVSPQMTLPEWQHVLKTANAAKIAVLVATIKEMSGLTQAEVDFAKKVAEQMGMSLTN